MNDINGFTFYKSYYECLCDLNQKDKEQILYAILEYVFEDKEPKFTGFKNTIWVLIKPNLTTSKNKSNNAKTKSNENQTKIKPKSKKSTHLYEEEDEEEDDDEEDKDSINRGAKANPIQDIINYMNTCGEAENFSIKQTFNFSNKASSNVKIINARLKENYTIEQLKDVIYNAYDKLVEHQFNGLNGKPSVQYYNPTTIFTSEKVEKYLNEYKNT